MSASLKLTPESFGHNIERWLNLARNNFLFDYWISFFSDPLTVAFLLFWEVAILGSNLARALKVSDAVEAAAVRV